MNRFLRNIILLLLAATLLVSTSGINIYLHYCSCEDQTIASVIAPGTCCDHQQESSVDACCADKTEDGRAILQKNDPDCCTSRHLFYRLITDLDISVKQYSHPILTASPAVIFNEPDTPASTTMPVAASGDHTPLLLHGKSLLTYLHQLRLDTPLA